jgi:hypothetical protein
MSAREQLMDMSNSLSTAAIVLTAQRDTIEDFLKECRNMESFGHIADPTLYRDPERRAVSAVLEPICKAALSFLSAYEGHTAKAQVALDAVKST